MSSVAARAAQRASAVARRIIAGQPTPETHPELLKPGEIQPGVSSAEFHERRGKLAGLLPNGGVAIIQTAPQIFMSGVVPYPFRPDADFYYLTGIAQHGVVAVINSDSQFTVFVPDSDPWREAWDGSRLTADAAREFFGADKAFPVSEMPKRLGSMLESYQSIFINAENDASAANSIFSLRDALGKVRSQSRLQSLRPLVHQLRWTKSLAELNLMRRSVSAATDAMIAAMKSSSHGITEHYLASFFEWRCKKLGAQRMAYPPVVAGGADAITIHYSRNDKKLTSNDLILFDGGCELFGYCSDVTRTWPIGGKFSGAQLDVYNAVLMAHRKLLAACRPGTTMRQLHHLSLRLLAESLKDLNIFPNTTTVDSIISDHKYRMFYPHSVGHLLGLDVHDAHTNSHDRPLESGVVLTIEPGLYIPDEEKYGHLRGIGVRIEDDVAITEGNPDILSQKAPIETQDIESIVGTCLQ